MEDELAIAATATDNDIIRNNERSAGFLVEFSLYVFHVRLMPVGFSWNAPTLLGCWTVDLVQSTRNPQFRWGGRMPGSPRRKWPDCGFGPACPFRDTVSITSYMDYVNLYTS
jgi:hypothetical protein